MNIRKILFICTLILSPSPFLSALDADDVFLEENVVIQGEETYTPPPQKKDESSQNKDSTKKQKKTEKTKTSQRSSPQDAKPSSSNAPALATENTKKKEPSLKAAPPQKQAAAETRPPSAAIPKPVDTVASSSKPEEASPSTAHPKENPLGEQPITPASTENKEEETAKLQAPSDVNQWATKGPIKVKPPVSEEPKAKEGDSHQKDESHGNDKPKESGDISASGVRVQKYEKEQTLEELNTPPETKESSISAKRLVTDEQYKQRSIVEHKGSGIFWFVVSLIILLLAIFLLA